LKRGRLGIWRQGWPEREGGGAICDGHTLFYCLDIVTTTGRQDSAGAGKKSWPAELEIEGRFKPKKHPLKIAETAPPTELLAVDAFSIDCYSPAHFTMHHSLIPLTLLVDAGHSWTRDVSGVLIVSLAFGAAASLVRLGIERATTAGRKVAQGQIEKIRKTFGTQLGNSPEHQSFLPLLFSTSASVDELRQQLNDIAEQVRKQPYEIVETSKIDPVLEATLKASIENLTKRIENLEKNQISKWDAALVSLQLFGGLGAIFALIFGAIKYLHP
jgi:hypothetical protein